MAKKQTIKRLSRIPRLDIDQFIFLDAEGETVGGVTIGINPLVPSRLYLMGLHIEGGSSLDFMRQLADAYPEAQTWMAYRAKDGVYRERPIAGRRNKRIGMAAKIIESWRTKGIKWR